MILDHVREEFVFGAVFRVKAKPHLACTTFARRRSSLFFYSEVSSQVVR
jgi:hypothetical protein